MNNRDFVCQDLSCGYCKKCKDKKKGGTLTTTKGIVYANTSSSSSQTKKNYSDSEDSSYSGSYSDSEYSSYSEEERQPTKSSVVTQNKMINTNNNNNSMMKGNLPSQEQMAKMKAEFDRLSQKADIKLYTVKYSGTRRLLPTQFLEKIEGENGGFKLRNDGKIVFSHSQKHLTREFGNNQPDFENIRPDQVGGKHDLIGKAFIKIRCNWPGKMTVGYPTITAANNHFYESNSIIDSTSGGGGEGKTAKSIKSQTVSFPIKAGTFKTDGTLFESSVLDNTEMFTNQLKDYANQFKGYNPDNMTKNTYETATHIAMPLDHPAVTVFNTDPSNKVKYTKPHPGFEETNQVFLPLEVGKKCIEIATKRVASRTPYGNVTDRFRLEISANMDYEREKSAMKGKNPFLGFADFDTWIGAQPNLYTKKLHPDSGLPMREHFEQTPILMDIEATFEYNRFNGKQIH